MKAPKNPQNANETGDAYRQKYFDSTLPDVTDDHQILEDEQHPSNGANHCQPSKAHDVTDEFFALNALFTSESGSGSAIERFGAFSALGCGWKRGAPHSDLLDALALDRFAGVAR
jgi:hypothetical protein